MAEIIALLESGAIAGGGSGSTTYITFKTNKAIGETVTVRVKKDEVLIPAYGVIEVSSEVTDYYYQTYTYKLTDQTVSIVEDPIHVDVSNNQLTYFRVVGNKSKVESIYCDDNQLTTLKVNTNYHLVNLRCYNNQLTELDVSCNTKLKILQCRNNRLTELKLCPKDKATTGFKTLSCYKNKLDATAMSDIIDNLLYATDINAELNLKHSTGEGNVVNDIHISAAKGKGYKVYIHDGSSWKEQ